MKKVSYFRSFAKICVVIVFALVVSACSFQKEVNVKSIEILEETVPDFILVGEFDKAGIKALITYEDGSNKEIDVNSNLLKDAYQEYISKSGEYEIEILFKGVSTKLNVKMVDVEEVHVVKFFNGLNELISMQFVEEGKDAVAPNAQSYLLNGYKFIGWDRAFTNVVEDINVYGIYGKIDEKEEEQINYHSILFEAAGNMRKEYLNVLEVWELSAKRIEKTLKHNEEGDLLEVVKKVIEENREASYHKYYKDYSSSEKLTYFYEKYDVSGEYPRIEIIGDEFMQYDVYGYVKKIVSSTDNLKYSKIESLNRLLYKLEVIVENDGDGNYASERFEFLFDEKQIVYVKRFLMFKNSVGCMEEVLSSSMYYFMNPTEVERVVYPKDVNLGEIVENVFNNDVLIQIEEMRDVMIVVEKIRNDGDNRAAIVSVDGVETYMWDKDVATYYTKEEINSNDQMVKVYKTVDSMKRYGNRFYYEWKNLSNCSSNRFLNDDGSVSIIFDYPETSSSRAHKIKFVVMDNKLLMIERYYYNANDFVKIDKKTFVYENVEVNVPQMLISRENSAILE